MSTITKPNTFSAGGTVFASEHNENFNTIYDDYNGNVQNVNIASDAAIVGSKLDLSAPGTIGGTTPSPGTFTNLTAEGNTALGNGADTLTINASSGITYTPAATWTFTAAQTVSGTWADLGSVTTIDINGGTIDGSTITVTAAQFNTGTTNQGDVYYDNGTTDLTRLTPGTSGQFLQTQGAAANPVWAVGPVVKTSQTTGDGTNTGNIAISPSRVYLVTFDFSEPDSSATVDLRFNSSSEAAGYAYAGSSRLMNTTDTESTAGDEAHSSIPIMGSFTANIDGSDGWARGQMYIDTNKQGTAVSAMVNGAFTARNASNVLLYATFGGASIEDLTIADFEFVFSDDTIFDINVYELT